MAATLKWAQSIGAGPTVSALGPSGNLFNFKRADHFEAVSAYSAFPITAGQRSYEVSLRAKFTGTFNSINNIQFWRSTDFSPSTGLFLRWDPTTPSTYTQNVTGLNQCVSAVPTSDPGTANVRIQGGLASALTASGYSDYIILQLATSTTASPGDTSLATFSLNYDES